ncbi:hypothetical protein [Aquimarina sp. 2201CG5-10]|uniref:hypothetical protein n=1 Tax=Aquimarina callyspongiae TaxID=3098150 RepID=UPI002AB466EF|nr:hypothetical protein [Aquimarina sp. 2201CG5-10]MDY8136456.1 hypothetical protein [Aquimarina sp. 2201CG5-10]
MRIPIQSVPVNSQLSQSVNGGINASSACSICKAGCSLLSGFKKTLCLLACDNTVC